jgi:predicted  nucleic acid-binding Zn-ribbon protein
MKVFVEISVGELFDKITILKIKTEKIKDEKKLNNIKIELEILQNEASKLPQTDDDLIQNIENLKKINNQLWDIENIKRELESSKDFGDNFINISRDVHFKNDERAKIKKKINDLTNSNVTEEKEYSNY